MICNFEIFYEDGVKNVEVTSPKIQFPDVRVKKIILTIRSETEDIILSEEYFDTCNSFAETLVINVKCNAEITKFNIANVCNDLILNVEKTLTIKDSLVCNHGKLFIKCGEGFIFKNITGCMYSYGDMFIFAISGIYIGEPKIGIESETDYTYKRVVKSELFISSNGNITLSSKSEAVHIEFCYVVSNKNITLGTPTDISNINVVCSTLRSITGSVVYKSKGTLALKRTDEKLYKVTEGYPYLGAAANHMGQGQRTLYKVAIKQEYPSSGPTIIEAMENVIFEGGNHVNTASTILCGKSFISKNYKEVPLMLGTMSKQPYNTYYMRNAEAVSAAGGSVYGPYDPEFVGTWYGNPEYISFSDYYIPNTSVYSTTVKTGESIQLNMGEFVVSGNMSSQRVLVSGRSSSFSRLSKTRDPIISDETITTTEDGTTYIKLNEYISQNLTPLERVEEDGSIVNKFHMDTPENQNKILHITEENSKLDPLIGISISPYVQYVLSGVANKVFVNSINSDNTLLNSLIQNTKEVFLRIKDNPRRELVLDKSIIYKESSEESKYTNTILAIPKCEKEWSNLEDTVCNEFINETDSQTYTNYRVIGKDLIKIDSSGSVSRNTEKYTEKVWWFDGEKKNNLTYDVSYPQQQFISKGNVVVNCKDKYSIVGGLTIGEHVKESANTLSKNPLYLNTTYSNEYYKSSGFSSSTHIEESLKVTSLLKTETITSTLKESARECINIVGANETAKESIEYTSKKLDVRCSHVTNSSEMRFNMQSHFSSVSGGTIKNESIFTPSILHTPQLVINSEKAKINADVIADEIYDNTTCGIEFVREIGCIATSAKTIAKSKMSSSESGSYDHKEIMNVCHLTVNKIIRNLESGCIIFEDTIFEKLKPRVVGKYLEVYYILKSHHTEYNHSSQVIPDGFIMVAALAISFFTMGLGAALTGLSGIGGCIANAAVTSVLVNTSTTLLKTGDISQSLESLFTKEYLRSLCVSVVTAGILGDLSNVYSSFLNRLGDTALRNVVNASVSKVIANDKISLTPKNIIKSTLINSIAGELSNKIGDRSIDKSEFMHKAAHFTLGSAMGFASGGTFRSALGGGLGVLASECIADYLLEYEVCSNPLKASQYSTLISASTCSLLKGDVNATIFTSVNAFENNRMMHLSSEGRDVDKEKEENEYLYEDDINEFIDEELSNFVFPGKKIKKMVNILEKEKSLGYPNYSKKYIMSYNSNCFSDDFSKEKWITVDSPLESVRKIVDRSMYNFSNIPNKSFSDLSPHEYFGIIPVYTLKSVAATDDFFGGYAQRILNTLSKYTHNVGNITRDVVYYTSGNASLSQDIGYTTTFALDTLLPIPLFKSVKSIKNLTTKTMGTPSPFSQSGSVKWSTKDIKACDVRIFDRGNRIFSFVERRIERHEKAPLIIIAHGNYKDISLKTQKLFIPEPKFNFKNNVPKSIVDKRILPNREFPVTRTRSRDMMYDFVEVDMNHRLLSKYIHKYIPAAKGNEIGMYSCYSGFKDFAQNLANKHNIVVHAPTKSLNIDCLFGTFESVDMVFVGNTPKVNPSGGYGTLKSFYPKSKSEISTISIIDDAIKEFTTGTYVNKKFRDSAASCIIPVIPSTMMYYGPERLISKNDEIVPFVKDGTDGMWYEGCISGDMNLINRNSGVSKTYETLKEKNILLKSEKCMFNISAHGSKDYIFIENSTDIDNGILNFIQEAEIKVDGRTQVDVEQFADILANSSKYKSNIVKHVNLFSCECGKDIDGFAQQLSDELQVCVSAFTGLALTHKKYFASVSRESNMYISDKEIKIFYPRPKKEFSNKYNLYDSKYKKSIFDE